VEPEVLVLDGDHDLQTSAKITQDVISACYRELIIQNVLLEGKDRKRGRIVSVWLLFFFVCLIRHFVEAEYGACWQGLRDSAFNCRDCRGDGARVTKHRATGSSGYHVLVGRNVRRRSFARARRHQPRSGTQALETYLFLRTRSAGLVPQGKQKEKKKRKD
jgi:hypothetical protein